MSFSTVVGIFSIVSAVVAVTTLIIHLYDRKRK